MLWAIFFLGFSSRAISLGAALAHGAVSLGAARSMAHGDVQPRCSSRACSHKGQAESLTALRRAGDNAEECEGELHLKPMEYTGSAVH